MLVQDQVVTQQLAALVAVVSIAIIGVAGAIISPIWKELNNKHYCVSQQRSVNRILFVILIPWLIFLFLLNIFGIYASTWVQALAKSYILFNLVIFVVFIIVHQIVRRIRKVPQSSNFEDLLFLYKFTLFCIGFCMFTCLIALFGVAYPMLNIEIGPFNQDSFNWARWFLIDGIFFFFMGMIGFACTYITKRNQCQRQADNSQKKKTVVKWAGWTVLVIILCLFLTCSVITIKQVDKKGDSFINAFMSIPLDVKGSVSIRGTQFNVINESDFDWEIASISLNKTGLSGGYTLQFSSLKKGETYEVDITEFSDTEGMKFNPVTMNPLRFSIDVYNSDGQHGIFSGALKKVIH